MHRKSPGNAGHMGALRGERAVMTAASLKNVGKQEADNGLLISHMKQHSTQPLPRTGGTRGARTPLLQSPGSQVPFARCSFSSRGWKGPAPGSRLPKGAVSKRESCCPPCSLCICGIYFFLKWALSTSDRETSAEIGSGQDCCFSKPACRQVHG